MNKEIGEDFTVVSLSGSSHFKFRNILHFHFPVSRLNKVYVTGITEKRLSLNFRFAMAGVDLEVDSRH